MAARQVPPGTPGLDRRRFIGFFGVTGGGLMLAGCGSSSFLDFTGGRTITTVDSAKPYRAVNPSEANAMINAYRARHGIAPLALDGRLNETALSYARKMAAADRLSHEIGGTLRQRLNASGYVFGVAGENIGVGYRDFAETFDGWKRSPAHDAGMKDTDMSLMGIASVHDPKTKWQTFWCLQFAHPKG